MNPSATALVTPLWGIPKAARPDPNTLLAALARTRLDEIEWRVVRRGLGLMAGSLAAFLVCTLGVLLFSWWLAKMEPRVLPLAFLFLLGLPISGAGFLAGVVLSLVAPSQARLGRRIGTYVVGMIAGVVLLTAASLWRNVPLGIAASWRAGPRVLLLAGLAALLIAHLGYSLYLIGVARRFGGRRLVRSFLTFFVGLALLVGLLALAETAFVYWRQRWLPPLGGDWKQDFFRCAGGILFGMETLWTALLWRLRQCLPRGEPGPEPDEE